MDMSKCFENVKINLKHVSYEINNLFFVMIMKNFHVKNLEVQVNQPYQFIGFQPDMNL
jgi:hypothetical protein